MLGNSFKGKIMLRLSELRYWYLTRTWNKLRLWFIWKLPRSLVYYCAIRLIAEATSGPKYGNTIVPELTACDALKRWDFKGKM